MYWKIISTSVTGQSHIDNGMPCQDSFSYDLIDNWGIAIISDGAGSCKNSQIGSNYISKRGIDLFKNLVIKENWNKNLPSKKQWRDKAVKLAQILSEDLKNLALKNSYEFQSLSATFIIVFFSKNGICSLNIGDGRGAVKIFNKWQSIVKPYHGEQVGMTVFLTSNIWNDIDEYVYTDVVSEIPEAFIILSDGFEKISFHGYTRSDEGYYFDANKPFEEFLNFILNNTQEVLKSESVESVNGRWEQFLKNGHPILEKETDDKTMVFGISEF